MLFDQSTCVSSFQFVCVCVPLPWGSAVCCVYKSSADRGAEIALRQQSLTKTYELQKQEEYRRNMASILT